MNSSRVTRAALGALITAGAIGVAASASAQGFDVQQFNPNPSQTHNAFGVTQAQILSGGQWEIGLMLNYADDPLVIVDEEGERIESIVSGQLAGNILFAVGVADRLELGLDIPLVLFQQGDELTVFDELDASDASFGLGDIRIVPTVLLFNGDTPESPGGAALALQLNTFLPTGSQEDFQGGEFRFQPTLAFDYATAGGIRWSVNAGFMVRQSPELPDQDLQVGNAMTWGTALDLATGDTQAFHIIMELVGEASLEGDIGSEQLPMELLLGGKYFLESGTMIQAGFGVGLLNGYGTPDWRGLLGVHYAANPNNDRDGDGILNNVDDCPEVPEDIDGFEDVDGCPDLDNDQDTILDVDDDCMMDPEDFDDFEDVDGCPDPDNDGDGILDDPDECPMIPEDIDGFEDEDGCIDPDDDNDGILDVDDGCRLDPEDIDGWEDLDGCPEPDNDRDGILDGPDECPDVAEDFDGFEDTDGCPEEGSGLVTLTCEAIEINETVQFRTNSDEIRPESFELLNQVGAVLNSASYITLARVEGHTDDRGDDDYNLELSQRRALSVFTYLTQTAGVDAGRLSSEGYGESVPIADNETSDGRAINRRVEFRIIEQTEACE